MTNVFDFKEQLAIGELGERLFIEHYPEPLMKSNSLKIDLVGVVSGVRIELKTDSYPMDKTPNFFFERWSDVDAKKPGSVWQCQKKVDRFIYFYSSSNTYFECSNIPALVRYLDTVLDNYPPVSIPNKGWTTVGHKIPREALAEFFIERKLVCSNQ